MSLPLSTLPHVSPAMLSRTGPSSVGGGAAASRFAAQIDGFAESSASAGKSHSVRSFRELPGFGRIEIETVTETTVGPDGKKVDTVKELAVCPECGTTNCACLARVTLQTRLDEENAKGPRDAQVPQPFSVLPQSFNQMSLNINRTQGQTSARLFG